MSDPELKEAKEPPVPAPMDAPVVNPPYEVPYGHADAPPPVPEDDPNLSPEAKAYLDAFHAPPDPRDPVAAGASDITRETAEDYYDSFHKPPDPRDPTDSVITGGELIPPAPGPEAEIDPPATDPPVNVDVPNLSQSGAVLNCTMGNWENEPTQYTYLWIADGLEVGPGTGVYDLVLDDVGRAYACVVTASNSAGATEAPASNPVTVEAFP